MLSLHRPVPGRTPAGWPETSLEESGETMVERLPQKKRPYPEEAFEFVRQGLPYTVRRTHGEPSSDLVHLEQWLAQNDIDFDQCMELYETGRLPPPVADAIEQLGGPDRLNRHVSGQELCWGLRDLAIERWGLLAKTVLCTWKVKETRDFGNIVFDLIDRGQLRRQPSDSLSDFKNVFDFSEAFDTSDIPESQD